MSSSSGSSGSKAQKIPPSSPIGMGMNSLAEKMKKHKVNKEVHSSLATMHMASSGVPLDDKSKLLKTAYLAGVKHAEESVSESSSTQNSALGNTDKTEEERLIETIRRGWPDQKRQALADIKGETGTPHDEDVRLNDFNYSYGDLKDKARMTPGSPDTTI